MTKKIKFAIAKARILSIDDDDIRDVISLKFLSILQNVLENSFRIQNFFDQVFDINSDKLSLCLEKQR